MSIWMLMIFCTELWIRIDIVRIRFSRGRENPDSDPRERDSSSQQKNIFFKVDLSIDIYKVLERILGSGPVIRIRVIRLNPDPTHIRKRIRVTNFACNRNSTRKHNLQPQRLRFVFIKKVIETLF